MLLATQENPVYVNPVLNQGPVRADLGVPVDVARVIRLHCPSMIAVVDE